MCSLVYTFLLKSVFVFGITLFAAFASWYHYEEEYLFQFFDNSDLASQFDYIVVGAGSAGAILALRLAQENGSNSVLLLEAGSYGGPVLNIPLSSQLIQLTDFDWKYKTTPQEHACKAFDNNQCLWPRGKAIGGSSRLNNMIHFDGHPSDYPQWFSSPNSITNYTSDIKPYFDHIKSYLLDKTHVPYLTELSSALLEAGREVLGVPIRTEPGYSTGFMVPMVNIKRGKRFLSGEYLMDNKPSNLKVLTHSFVEKVVFGQGGDLLEATGVVFKRFGEVKKVFAKKAVIVSAGTISSPHLLMLSGLGPSSHLASHFIPTLIDLPQVGQNLQDHVTTGFDLFHLNQPLESVTPAAIISARAFLRYNLFADGPWTSNQCDAIAVLYLDCLIQDFGYEKDNKDNARKLNETYKECEKRQTGQPDLQLMLLPMGFNSDRGVFLRSIVGLKDEMWDNYLSHHIDLPTFFIIPIVLHPKSIGHVSLISSSPETPPAIKPNYLSHPYDVKTLVRGLKLTQELVEKGTIFQEKLGAKLNVNKVPGCIDWEFGSLDYWECYVREVTLSVYHPVGTCKMGKDSKSSVVDYNFLVHGTKNLYIVDASVMPSLPSGNINAAVIMLAEKASGVINKKFSEEVYAEVLKNKNKVASKGTSQNVGAERENKWITKNKDNNLKVSKIDKDSGNFNNMQFNSIEQKITDEIKVQSNDKEHNIEPKNEL